MKMAGVIVMWVMLAALALCALLLPFARHADRRGRPGLLRSALSNLRRITLPSLLALFTAFIGSVAHSGKTNGGTGTTGILPVATVATGYVIPTGGTPVVPVTVTLQEITQGYRLESVTTNDAVSYAMPTNGVEYAPWNLRGGYETHFPLDLGDFAFPFGTSVVHRLDVLSGGTVESLPRQRGDGAYYSLMSICAAREWASIVPGVGRFWWADAARPESAPYQVKLLTWENVYAGRDRTGLYNAQIELFGDGNFITRSNDVERVYRRVLPFDWDDDGLENSVDPDPLTAGPDAHGTNAEWYNAVCSNIVVAAPGGIGVPPIHFSWREGVNSNAYYFVDVVAAQGPAPIYFTGDRDSRLGNPVVVAQGGETNHVPLLIGIEYAITSPVPVTVSLPAEYMYPVMETGGPCCTRVRWPLNFVFNENIGGANRVYTVSVEPFDPGGVLEWTGTGGGIPMRGESQSEGCDCIHYGFDSFFFTCSSECTCSMGCTAEGCYHLENATFFVKGAQCRCGFDDPPYGGTPSQHEPDDPPSLTITFSQHAVLFEEAYEDRPGETVQRRSTRVRLTVDAFGGTQGAALWLSELNMNKLTAVSGGVPLPYSRNLAAGESYYATGVYEGVEASGSEEDVRVTGTLTPMNGAPLTAEVRLTSVRILLKPDVDPPEEGSIGRHEYGVCELVEHNQYPTVPAVTWNPVGGGSNTVNRSGRPCFQFPLYACKNPLRVELNNVSYVPRLTCIEPDGIKAGKVELCTYGLPPGKAGGIGLLQEYYVTPFTVSFSRISIEEVPCDQGTVEGYFLYGAPSNRWSHTRAAGAGRWYDVDIHNRVGGNRDILDEATLGGELFPVTPDGTLTNDYSFGWMDGTMVWQVPFGWNVYGTQGETEPFKTFGSLIQEFYIDRSGNSGVRKFGKQALRLIDDRRFLGVREVFTNIVLEVNHGE